MARACRLCGPIRIKGFPAKPCCLRFKQIPYCLFYSQLLSMTTDPRVWLHSFGKIGYRHVPPGTGLRFCSRTGGFIAASMTDKQSDIAAHNTAVIIVAAGKGLRAASSGSAGNTPKQYRIVGKENILSQCVMQFSSCDEISSIVVVIGADDHDRFHEAGIDTSCVLVTKGGATRQASVLAGLDKLAEARAKPDFVLIHDAARPFVGAALIRLTIESIPKHGTALPVLPLSDTIKQVSGHGVVEQTPDRSKLFAAQTPQGFVFSEILAAHRKAAREPSVTFTDDASIAEWAGISVHTIDGDPRNFKITTPDDFVRAEMQLGMSKPMETRTGQGFDVHRFTSGDHVILGGVKIPHDKALSGHSDADVLLHAITDALYGAIADGDIGAHFPPSDPQWKGADSSVFLEDAVTRVRNRGGEITFLDATILCETPKIGPHRDKIRNRIAEMTGVAVERIAVKATTTEQLGFTGRREGIAAMALATIRLSVEN